MEQQIELGDFIQKALLQIANGIRGANKEIQKSQNNTDSVFNLRNTTYDPKIPGIKFDVAVTTVSGQKDKTGFAVALVNIGGGANTEKSKEGHLVHRIQFDVGVVSDWF